MQDLAKAVAAARGRAVGAEQRERRAATRGGDREREDGKPADEPVQGREPTNARAQDPYTLYSPVKNLATLFTDIFGPQGLRVDSEATLPGEQLYKSYGFRQTERVMIPMPDGTLVDGVVMMRPIDPSPSAK